jgi:hypothetical protein
MSDEYTIHYQEIADALAAQGDVDAFGQQHGVARIAETFKVMQDLPPNPGQKNLRVALQALGFDFRDDQAVVICHDQASPLVDD